MLGGKPNVLITLPGEVGGYEVGRYRPGVMGSSTAKIDRIAVEGVRLTDCYAGAGSTAEGAAALTGQLPMRTGLTLVGWPAALEGLPPERPTLWGPLTPLGYATAQIGRHHLGDRNRFVPTVHGFDELLANLTHLNVVEEPASSPTAHVTTRRWDSSGGRRLTSTRKQMLNSVPPDAANGIATKESTAL